MKLSMMVTIIITGFVFILSLALAFHDKASGAGSFGIIFGLTGIIASLLCVIVGTVLYVTKIKEVAQGFFMASGILFLLGFLTCTGVIAS